MDFLSTVELEQWHLWHCEIVYREAQGKSLQLVQDHCLATTQWGLAQNKILKKTSADISMTSNDVIFVSRLFILVYGKKSCQSGVRSKKKVCSR